MHVSMALPPPTAIEPVDLLAARVLGGLLHRAIGGLDLDAVPDVGLDALLLEERAHALGEARARRGRRSVTISALRMPEAAASKPISSVAPRPNLIGDISITNTVSVGSVTPFMRASSGWRCVGISGSSEIIESRGRLRYPRAS